MIPADIPASIAAVHGQTEYAPASTITVASIPRIRPSASA